VGEPRFVYTAEMLWVLLHVHGQPMTVGKVAAALVQCRLPRGVQGEWNLRNGTVPAALESLIHRGAVGWTEADGYAAALAPVDGAWLRKLSKIASAALTAAAKEDVDRVAFWRRTPHNFVTSPAGACALCGGGEHAGR
jgi:hypothetical protein